MPPAKHAGPSAAKARNTKDLTIRRNPESLRGDRVFHTPSAHTQRPNGKKPPQPGFCIEPLVPEHYRVLMLKSDQY